MYKKKIAIYWGNCHASYTSKILAANKEFNKLYSFYQTDDLWTITEKDVNYTALKNCDLIIYQDIRENNSIGPFASTENMKQYLSKDCNLIKIPNLYGFSKFLYPQTNQNTHEAVKTSFFMDNHWWSWYRDSYIDEYIEKNPKYNIDELIEYLKNLKINTEHIDEQFKIFWEKIDKIENNCEIKIKKFIKDNFLNKQLFMDTEHPAICIFEEYARQICLLLNIKDTNFSPFFYSMYGHGIPIYPQIKEYFNFNWEEHDSKIFKIQESLTGNTIDFAEYVRQYCKIYTYWENINNKELKLN